MELSSLKNVLQEELEESQALIPGLPQEVAEKCLLYLPYPYQPLVRSVSSSWNRAINDPVFHQSKRSLLLTLPYFFVLTSHSETSKLQWQAYDPRSNRWFILPPMPYPYSSSVSPSSFSCTSLDGSLYVLGGGEPMDPQSNSYYPLESLLRYSTLENKWTQLSHMRTPRSYFASGAIGSRLLAVGGGDDDDDTNAYTESYDRDTDTWGVVAGMHLRLERYESVVLGNKMYVTEGWTWPFSYLPRGMVYDPESDTWEEMRLGMRDGWTGLAVVVGERLFMISEHGECPVKYYIGEKDQWRHLERAKFPRGAVRRPFKVGAAEGRIYVTGSGMNLVVGRVAEEGKEEVSVEWEVMRGPKAFEKFVPRNAQVVYA